MIKIKEGKDFALQLPDDTVITFDWIKEGVYVSHREKDDEGNIEDSNEAMYIEMRPTEREVSCTIVARVDTSIILDPGETFEQFNSRFVDIYLHSADGGDKQDLGSDCSEIVVHSCKPVK